MSKKLSGRILCIAVLLIALSGCKPTAPNQDQPASSANYFQTSFQSESQFIVEAIVSDLAEQMYFAANHRLPEKKYFSVTATESPGSPIDAPNYDLVINLDQQHRALKFKLAINGPIWSPGVYDELAKTLAQTTGLTAGSATRNDSIDLLPDLLDVKAETIEQDNLTLSSALEKNFKSPQLHEQAALLLGAFLMRDHSGYFFAVLSPLSRLTAHLAMARYLGGSAAPGVAGQLAEAMMLTMVHDQALALEKLKSLDAKDNDVASMILALQARNNGDYRLLLNSRLRTPVENVACFMAMADYARNSPMAWLKLKDQEKQTIDYVRAANQTGYSVEMGHELLATAIPLELREINAIYELSQGKKLSQGGAVAALNEMPERCFTGSGAEAHVRIIGWGQWADFLQRHLCHAVQQNFNFMQNRWGVPDEARKFAEECDKQFNGLRLYPFVRRFNCTDINGYHSAVDDAFKVTVAAPQLVPAECWNHLCYRVAFAPLYAPNPNPHINEWHDHNPPPGTVYNLSPRLNHPSLTSRADAATRFDQLHELAPYDVQLVEYIIKRKYNEKPTYEQAKALYEPLLPWSVYAMTSVAETVRDRPPQYEALMLQAAKVNPACYYELADSALLQRQEDKAAEYRDKACENDPDSVRVANIAEWRVRYYFKKGQVQKAREIADFAGEVYSFDGLKAKGVFMELTKNYSGAFEWYAKIEERYDNAVPLIDFCQKYKAATGDTRFDKEMDRRNGKIFPQGMERASVADFHGVPKDGVLVKEQNDLVLAAGMKQGEVIVAINHIRVHNFNQYMYIRDFYQTSTELDLIVWQGGFFNEIKTSPPNRRFGVSFSDYLPKGAGNP